MQKYRDTDEVAHIDDEALNHLYKWYDAAVTDYDYKHKLWSVLTLDGLQRKFLLPRIYIRFYAEDPRVFAKRLATAIEHRKIADASIK